MRIRPATPEDAEVIAAVHVASWRATYRGIFADEVLDGPDLAANRLRLWQRLLGPDRPDRSATVVAERADGVIVGFAFTTASRDDDSDAGTAELNSIYARPDAWGTGAGRELMTAALGGLRDAGFAAVTLWVLDGNARARRFYERAGFAPDGASKTEPYAGTTITEVRYRRPL
ncbi:MAG: GNAT family N-acetyltransferase [Actinobacteria bacterium]|nr:GNAT family N-acetyltransferase [Actinomycetota bacterium]